MSRKKPHSKAGTNSLITTNPESRFQVMGFKFNRLEKEQLIAEIIQFIVDGKSKGEIKEYLVLKNKKISERYAYKLIEDAHIRLEEIGKQEVGTIINIHVNNYEKIYRYMKDVDNVKGQNKTMRAKELLLGILKEENKVVINQKKTTVFIKEPEYDVTKLNAGEQSRLQYLIKKAQ